MFSKIVLYTSSTVGACLPNIDTLCIGNFSSINLTSKDLKEHIMSVTVTVLSDVLARKF